MNAALVFAGIKLAFTDGPAIQAAVDRGLADPIIRAGLAAAVDVAVGLKSAVNSSEAHAILVEHGVDPAKVTAIINQHVGPQPEGPGQGANV